MIIAVDFDDTLKINNNANVPLINRLLREQKNGNIIILWTCRAGDSLKQAVEFLARHGLRPNYVNSNAVETIRRFGYDPRKVFADIYIDDKAVH